MIKKRDIEICKHGDNYYVRISIGGQMYFDSPLTSYDNAKVIYDNLLRRVEWPH